MDKTSANTQTDRLHYMDNIKCLLIFLVVLTHFLLERTNPNINAFVNIVYCFHMPIFVFISGFFSKSDNSTSSQKLLRLLILYILANGFFCIIMGLIYGQLNLVTPFYMTWYILALIVWRLIIKHIGNIKGILFISIILAIVCGFYQDVTNKLAISRIICFFPFFLMGYKLSQEKIKKLRQIPTLYKILITLFSLLTVAMLSLTLLLQANINLDALTMAPYTNNSDAIIRILIMVFAVIMLLLHLLLSTNKKIPIITTFGKNSLTIYIFHRIFALIFNYFFLSSPPIVVFISATLCTIIVMFLFGNNVVHEKVNLFLDSCYNTLFNPNKDTKKIVKITTITIIIIMLSIITITPFIVKKSSQPNNNIVYNRITEKQQEQFDNAFTITFSGDLILLEDQVKRAYNGTDYNFDNMFTYTRDILSASDLTIGVFEGPMAGEDKGYSTSNFDDGKELTLNFPDSFATAVKNAGYDIVTTANNHVLDKDIEGLERTINVLESIDLDYVGSYKSAEHKQANKIYTLEKDGLKFCILAYTYGINGYTTNELTSEYSYTTNIIADPSSSAFSTTKEAVIEDFKKAKEQNPDFIIVLPHWGEQFTTTPNLFQKTWEKVFIENGADIILGDHTHSVQPTKIIEHNGKNVFVAYSPGNYTNIYQEHDGDACILTHTYIDKETKEIIGGAITPMWGYSQANGNYTAIPINTLIKNTDVQDKITTHDLKRAKEVLNIITNTQFGHIINIDQLQTNYYFDKSGYLGKPAPKLVITEDLKQGVMYNILKIHSHICFIGDSITAGTLNNGYGWYEPLLSYTEAKTSRVAEGGATIKTILNKKMKHQLTQHYMLSQ